MTESGRTREYCTGNPPSADLPLLVQGLTVTYENRPALWNIDYSVAQGTLSAIIGPNGAGKSTLLKAVLDLVPRLAGKIMLFGQPLQKVRGLVAYIPQRADVDWDFPASVLDVVTMGLYANIGTGRPVRRRHREAAREFLDRVALADLADRQIGQLSGGQQQRVFVARALAQNARLYLMDEPFNGIDAATETALAAILQELKQSGASAVCVHHDLQTVNRYFDHLHVLNLRSIAAGPIDKVLTSKALGTAYEGQLTEFRDPSRDQSPHAAR